MYVQESQSGRTGHVGAEPAGGGAAPGTVAGTPAAIGAQLSADQQRRAGAVLVQLAVAALERAPCGAGAGPTGPGKET